MTITESALSRLDAAAQDGASAVLDQLVEQLRAGDDPHKLFDGLMLREKFQRSLPLTRPASLEDVPQEQRDEVEKVYIAAAREVGHRFLQRGDIPSAWMYFQVIREPQPVAEAIDQIPLPTEPEDGIDELLNIALFQGVNPVKALAIMLRLQGTCSTITSLDQSFAGLSVRQRHEAAAVMVRHLYDELVANVRADLERRNPMLPRDQSLRQLITANESVFEGGNYHIDASHLNSTVRFARSLEAPSEELDLALQLCEYGTRLAEPLQYPGEPPFEDFFEAHRQFLKVLLDQDRESALDYFRNKLDQEPDERDRPLLAYVLVDLLIRADRNDEAIDVARRYLVNLGDQTGLSFIDLCLKSGRSDVLREVAMEQQDPVSYATALVAGERGEGT